MKSQQTVAYSYSVLTFNSVLIVTLKLGFGQQLMGLSSLPGPEWRKDFGAGRANPVKARARGSGDLQVGLDRACARATLPLFGAGKGF